VRDGAVDNDTDRAHTEMPVSSAARHHHHTAASEPPHAHDLRFHPPGVLYHLAYPVDGGDEADGSFRRDGDGCDLRQPTGVTEGALLLRGVGETGYAGPVLLRLRDPTAGGAGPRRRHFDTMAITSTCFSDHLATSFERGLRQWIRCLEQRPTSAAAAPAGDDPAHDRIGA
jgi:hypothetical protein